MWEFPWKHWSIVWCFKPSHFVNIWVSSFSKSNTIPKPQVVSLLDTSVNELHAFWRNGLNAARPAATNFFFTSLLMTPWIFDKKKENHHQFNVNIEQWTINSCLFNVFFSSLEWFSISSPIESMTHRTWSKNTIMPHNWYHWIRTDTEHSKHKTERQQSEIKSNVKQCQQSCDIYWARLIPCRPCANQCAVFASTALSIQKDYFMQFQLRVPVSVCNRWQCIHFD